MALYERLSALDASFLDIEDDSSHMHVAVDSGLSEDSVRIRTGRAAVRLLRRGSIDADPQ